MATINPSRILPVHFLICFIFLANSAVSQSIYDEAARHLVRGKAAAEAAKSPGDYEKAITEFKEAVKLVPNWPNAHYNLGIAQDKAGHFWEAAESLEKYLALAPNAQNAEEVRSLLQKFEAKGQEAISDDNALDIFASLADKNQWRMVGRTPEDLPGKIRWIEASRRDGSQISITYMQDLTNTGTIRVKPNGKTLSFATTYHLCDKSMQSDECPEVSRYSLEIVSRNKVKVNIRKSTPEIKPSLPAETSQHSFVLIRK